MPTKTIALATAAFFACLASGQAPAEQSRVFHFTNAATVQEFGEMATLIRSIADIQDATGDNAQRTLALRGSAEKIALAEWLYNELDKPPSGQPPAPHPASREYRVSDSSDDVVRVFYLVHTDTVQQFQEVATLIRSIAEIPRVFTYNSTRSMVVRGTAGQIAMAEWLVNELDKPASGRSPAQDPAIHEYRASTTSDDVVRVFYLTHAETVQSVQEVATLIRSIADIRRLFTYNAPRAMAARGTAGQIALAEWLFNELNKPTSGPHADTQDYRMSGNSDDVVRVFYLPHAGTVQGFHQIVTQIRSTTEIRRAFTYNAPRALALRGTADQLALAGRMIAEQNKSDSPHNAR